MWDVLLESSCGMKEAHPAGGCVGNWHMDTVTVSLQSGEAFWERTHVYKEVWLHIKVINELR